jgi:hypothetical protein
MKTETIPFREFMDGSWKKPKSANLLPAVAFVPNEPTTFLVTMVGIGLVVLIAEHCLQDTDYADKIRTFRTRYVKFVFPASVVATGVYVFIKIVNIFI